MAAKRSLYETEPLPHALDRAIIALTEPQEGVASHRQLLAAGLGRSAIKYRVASLRLHTRHHGVYAVGRADLSPKGRLMAAVLACGPTALLSHRSAADHWGLLATSQTHVDITVPGTSRANRPGIRVHRARTLAPDEITTHQDIPITSVARTLLDLAGMLGDDRTLRAVEQADRLQLLDFTAIVVLLERHARRRGTPRLRRILADYAGPPDTRAGLERDFHQLVNEAGLPKPLLNQPLAGLIVDVYWPQWRLVVELDSRRFHLDRRAFENDRARDAKLMRARLRVLRVTHRRLTEQRAQVLDDILALAALADTAA